MSDCRLVLPKPYQGFELSLSQSGTQGSCVESRCRGVPALYIIWLVVLAISAVSALPIMGISVVQTGSLGDKLLQEVAEQQFHVMHVSIQAALDEGDYWADFLEGWLRHRPPPLLASELTAQMQDMMMTWLATVARRVAGMCSAFVSEMSPYGRWQFCAARILYNGRVEYHWEYMPNGTTMYEVRTDQYFNLLNTVASWGAYKTKPQFSWPDGRVEWDEPSTWVEGDQVTTEMGQHRMVKVGNASIVNRFWMEDTDWAGVLRTNLNASLAVNPADPPIAFLFSDAGQLITATCGATNRLGKLINVNDSDCGLVSEAYEALKSDGHLLTGSAFYRATLPSGAYLLGLRRVSTTRSGMTPYFLATAYPCDAVDQPVRWTVSLLVIVCMCSLCLTIVVASVLTTRLIAKPLRDVARDLDRCVGLDIAKSFRHSRTPIRELSSILDSLGKVKGTLQAVTKFVPVPVVQRSLRLGEPIAMSMTPTEASVMFLDIQNFTQLTESTETGRLVLSVAAFFDRLSEVVVTHHGTIDKYIGDCMMAFWNTPTLDLHHQLHACEAALACLAAMEDRLPQLLPLRGRIGMEAGPVYAGLFGSQHRMNYTVVGDVVNVASRLESLNKQYDTRILIGPKMHAAVSRRVVAQPLPATVIRGKAERLVPYQLVGLSDPDPDPESESEPGPEPEPPDSPSLERTNSPIVPFPFPLTLPANTPQPLLCPT
eukprot:EG_transcript_2388